MSGRIISERVAGMEWILQEMKKEECLGIHFRKYLLHHVVLCAEKDISFSWGY